jgi:phosphoribosylcarboxyaminoimidazole (NCAIR) mutase
MTIAVLAGSKSDENEVNKVVERLAKAKKGLKVDVSYISAHRELHALINYMEGIDHDNRYRGMVGIIDSNELSNLPEHVDFYIALAGLTNALAGTVAALTDEPVIGVPLWNGSASSPGGLESILSVTQLPPPKDRRNVAIGATALNGSAYAADFVSNCIDAAYRTTEFDVCVLAKEIPDKEVVGIAEGRKALAKAIESFRETAKSLALNVSYEIGQELPKDAAALDPNKAKVYVIVSTQPIGRMGSFAKDAKIPIVTVPILSDYDVRIFKGLTNCEPLGAGDEIALGIAVRNIFGMAPQGPGVTVGYNASPNAATYSKKLVDTMAHMQKAAKSQN